MTYITTRNILIGIIIIIILFLIKNITRGVFRENYDNSNEAVQNIASVYNKDKIIVSSLETNNIKSGNIDVNTLNILPKGVIVMWSGNNVPTGWVMCDGQNGSPDLRGRFVRMYSEGAFSGNENNYDNINVAYDKVYAGYSRNEQYTKILKHRIGDKGGSDTMILKEDEMPKHTHNSCVGSNGAGGMDRDNYGAATLATTNRPDFPNGRGGSCRGLDLPSKGDNQPHNNQPPYYVLAFIMKI